MILLAGCGAGGGADTPEACCEALKSAIAQKDLGAFYDCLTPESQDVVAGGAIFAGHMMKMLSGFAAFGGPEAAAEAQAKLAPLNELLEKHGINDDLFEQIAAEPTAMGDSKALAELGNKLADKRQFIVEFDSAMEAMDDGGINVSEELGPFAEAEVKSYEVNGDRATIVLAMPDGEQPLEFHRLADGWRLHLDLEQIMGEPVDAAEDEWQNFPADGDAEFEQMPLNGPDGDVADDLDPDFVPAPPSPAPIPPAPMVDPTN